MKEITEGSIVRLVKRGVHAVESKDWTLGSSYVGKYKLEFGVDYEVTRAYEVGDVKFLDFKDMFFTHVAEKFALSPSAVVIVLRRPVDRRSIEKYLGRKGYTYDKIVRAEYQEGAKDASRVIIVHKQGDWSGQLTYNDPETFEIGAKAAVENTLTFIKSFFKHKEIRVIKTKPSVKQAIVELEKFI